MNIAVILAGGIGSRVGKTIPKQFIQIFGKPILAYTIEKFENHNEIDAIEVVCKKEYKEELKEIIKKYNYSKVKWIVDGGKNFQESTLNGIRNLEEEIEDDDIIVIHCGVAPLVSEDIISDGIKVAKENGNATSSNPIFLLAGSNDDGKKSTQWIDRDKVMLLISPHCFKYKYIKELYKKAEKKGYLKQEELHTTTLMYMMGETVYFSKGSQSNIKITTKEDIDLFKGYIMMQKLKEDEISEVE